MKLPRLKTLTGLKKYAAAFALGAAMTLAMPPLGIFPVLLLCVPGMIALSATAPSRGKAFLTGWAFGAGYFIFGLYWVSAALFVDIGLWGWLLPFSAVLGPAAVALYYGFIPLAAWPFRRHPVAHAAAIVAAWAGIEWLRGHLFTGFPWNLPGYSWMHNLPVMQVAAFAGIYGLTLLTLAWAAVPAVAGHKKLAGAALLSFIAVSLLGMARLAALPDRYGPTVRIVQPNIPQSQKWDRDAEWRNLERTIALTAQAPAPSLFIWPETAVRADLALYPEIAKIIMQPLPADSHGILGALRVTNGGDRFYNSVSTLDKNAEVTGNYNKHHLVPFGEYVPFRHVLNITPIALALTEIGDFTRGAGPRTLAPEGMPPFSPLVCYEVIFPRAVIDGNNRPAWMVNVTNDGWYGRTAGPHQHFETARLRAVEEGLPLARSANTGISGMIGPTGRIVALLPLGETGIVDAPLPRPLPPTLYARLGDSVFFILLAAMAGFTVWTRKKSF